MAVEEVGARLTLRDRVRFSRDAREAADDVERIGDSAESSRDRLKRLETTAGKFGDKVGTLIGRGVGTASRGLLGLGKAAGIGLATAGAALTLLGGKVLQLAVNAGETESAFRTVFGKDAGGVQAWVTRTSTAFGNTTASLQDATRSFGVLGQSAGMSGDKLVGFSTRLTQAALDLASFYNVSSEESFGAILSGLSGEAEPLKRFSIFMSDAALNAYAAGQGIKKTTQKMTEQEKVALRGAFILDNLGKANGDLARTSGGLANQQRALQGRLEETGTILGKALLPAATRVATGLNAKLGPAMGRLQDALPGMERAVSGFTDKTLALAESFALGWKLEGIDGVVKNLDLATGSGGKLFEKFEQVRTTLTDVVWPTAERIFGTIGTALKLVADNTTLAYYALGIYLARSKLLLGVRALMIGAAVAQGVWAAATGAHTAATTLNAGATTRQVVAHRAAQASMIVGRAATLAWTGATLLATGASKAAALGMRVLNAVLRANPVGLIVTGIGLLAAGLVLAYKKSDTFRGIVDKLWDKVKGLLGSVKGLVEWVGKIDFPSLPSWLGGGDDKPKAPDGARALGGPVRAGGTYLVGEQGPELVMPRSSGFVLDAPRTASLLGAAPSLPADGSVSGGIVVNVGTINESGDPRRTLEAVRIAVRDELARR